MPVAMLLRLQVSTAVSQVHVPTDLAFAEGPASAHGK